MLELDVEEPGPDVRVVTVVGEVDTLTAPDLADVLPAQLAAARLVVINLGDVELFGSVGLQVLVEANELAVQDNRGLRLVCHSRMVNRTLEVSDLRQCFVFVDNVLEVVQALP